MALRTNGVSRAQVAAMIAAAGGGNGTAMYDAVVAPSGGDYNHPEAAQAAGKTKLFIRDGTYVLTDAFVPTDGMVLIGETPNGVIFDASGCTYGVHIGGAIAWPETEYDSPYHAGTIAVNSAVPSDPTKVIGTSTEWVDTAWIESGHCIIVYNTGVDLIDSVSTNTSLFVQNGFMGRNNGSLYYCIFPVTKNVVLKNITVTGASTANILMSHAYNCLIEDVCVLNSGGYGLHVRYAAACTFNRIYAAYAASQCVYCGNGNGVDTGMAGFGNLLQHVNAYCAGSEGIRVNGGWNRCTFDHCSANCCAMSGFSDYSADTTPERLTWSRISNFNAFGNGAYGLYLTKSNECSVINLNADGNATDATITGANTTSYGNNT